jgi:hypothetical protein
MWTHVAQPIVLALFLAPSAWAQTTDGLMAQQSAGVPGCYVLTVYGLVATCTLSPAQQDEIASRAAEYLTDGAGVTGVPTSGPGATYFHDASRVLAAPTTSWVQTVNPELGAGTFEGSGVAEPRGSASASTRPAPPEPPAAPSSAAQPVGQPSAPPVGQPSAPPSAPAAAVPDGMVAPDESPPVLPLEAVPAGTAPVAVASSVSAPVALPRSSVVSPSARDVGDEPDNAGPTNLRQSVLFAVIGTPIGAVLVFLGVRALAARARRP